MSTTDDTSAGAEANQEAAIEGFAIALEGHPTQVHVHKFADGAMGFFIETQRPGQETYRTSLRLTPETLAMLSEAYSPRWAPTACINRWSIW